jgi:hypothetical protein
MIYSHRKPASKQGTQLFVPKHPPNTQTATAIGLTTMSTGLYQKQQVQFNV